MINFLFTLVSFYAAVVYPMYASMKAIERKRPDDDTLWLTYWIVYISVLMGESLGFVYLWVVESFFFGRSPPLALSSTPQRGAGRPLKSLLFFSQKTEEGKTHKNKVFPHSILLSAPARIVSKQTHTHTHTHTHKREEERNKEKGEKRGDDDDDDDENNAKICLDWRVWKSHKLKTKTRKSWN